MDFLAAPAHDLRRVFSRKLGRCTRCIRAAALGTALSWAAVAVALLVQAPSMVLAGLIGISVVFTALAVAHAVAYGRSMALSRRATRDDETPRARRALLGDVLKFASGGLAAAVAGPLLRPSSALATHCGPCPKFEGPAEPYRAAAVAKSKDEAESEAEEEALQFCAGVCSQYACQGGLICEAKRKKTRRNLRVDCERQGDGFLCETNVFTCYCECD